MSQVQRLEELLKFNQQMIDQQGDAQEKIVGLEVDVKALVQDNAELQERIKTQEADLAAKDKQLMEDAEDHASSTRGYGSDDPTGAQSSAA